MDLRQSYAQTNVQLFAQLTAQGWSEAEVLRVRRAYDFAASLHSARFRPSGRPFLTHLIGTASLLAQCTPNRDTVLAGLLHAVYDQGDFGDGRRVVTPRKRARVRSIVGESVERLVAAFSSLPWSVGTAPEILTRVDVLEESERGALLIRLANELEDFIQLDALYGADHAARMAQLQADAEAMCQLALALGQPKLAEALGQVTSEACRTEVPDAFRTSERYCFDRVPASCRRRWLAAFNHRRPWMRWHWNRARHRLRHLIPQRADEG